MEGFWPGGGGLGKPAHLFWSLTHKGQKAKSSGNAEENLRPKAICSATEGRREVLFLRPGGPPPKPTELPLTLSGSLKKGRKLQIKMHK